MELFNPHTDLIACLPAAPAPRHRHPPPPCSTRFIESGGVFKLEFGPKAFIVVSDPVVVRHLLKVCNAVWVWAWCRCGA